MELLLLSEQTILKLLNNGDIIAFKTAGGAWRVLREEYDAYVQRNIYKPYNTKKQ